MVKLGPIVISTTIILLSSCTMAPNYKQPDLPVKSKIEYKQEQTAADATISDAEFRQIKWTDFYQDVNLKKLLEITLENNRDLRIAALNVKAAKEQFRIKLGELVPALSANGAETRVKTPEAVSASGSDYISTIYDANISASYEVDLFGRIRSESNRNFQRYLSQQANQDAVRISLIAETANSYINWLGDKKILELTEKTYKSQSESYKLIEKRFQNGIASKLELAQAKITVQNAAANKALYERKLQFDKSLLELLAGANIDNILKSDADIDNLKFSESLPIEVKSETLLSRPDIQKAEYELKARNADIGAARAAFFPSILLTGTLGYASMGLSSLFTDAASGAWSFIPQATMPIFSGGRNYANLKYSKVQKEIATAEYEKSIQTAFKETYDQLVSRKTLSDQYGAQKELVKSASEAYDLAYARYQSGLDSYLTSLDSQRNLYNYKQQLIETQKLVLSNIVNIYKVLGAGVSK